MPTISISVKSLKRGPIPDDGTMGTMLTPFDGGTYKDSASLKEDKPAIFNVQIEEQDDPEFQFVTKGAKTVAFSLVDYSPETIQLVKGGTIVNGVWCDPLNAEVIEEAYQIISQTDVLFEIPRGSVSAVFNAELKKSAAALLDVTVTPLRPNFVGIPGIMISNYTAPVVNAGADQPNVVVDNANLVGTANAYRGAIVSQAWTCTAQPAGAPAPGIATPAALATAVTGLQSGVYTFTLTAVDVNGYTNTATVTITVALP